MTSRLNEAPFVLKHRLVGAAVLIVFGVIVLPWMLSNPNQAQIDASIVESGQLRSASNRATETANVDEQLDSLLANDLRVESAEEVYVSRITEANQETNQEAELQTESQTATQSEKPPLEAGASAQILTDAVTLDNKSPETVLEASLVEQEPVPSQSAIKQGWTVQAGVFVEIAGANSLVNDLRAKGFSPKTVVVDTNQGSKTGTRVYLGPFASRDEASASKAELKLKTGEDGFIRSFP